MTEDQMDALTEKGFDAWLRLMPEADYKEFLAMGPDFYEVVLAAFQGGFVSGLAFAETGEVQPVNPMEVH